MRLGAIAAGLLLAIAPLAAAPAQDALNIINDPAAPQVNGATARLRDDPAVQGGKALRIQVKRKGANPWDVAAESAISKPIAAGDQLLMAFWVRLEKGEGGATTGTLNYNAIQLGAEPYTTLLSGPVEIGPEWKLAEIRGKADKDYAAGTLKATIHLASAAQTVDLGPIFVVNLGPE